MSVIHVFDLAKTPLILAAPAEEYDFERQMRVSAISETSLAVTHAGTQTHNNQGRPIDKDND